MNQKKMLIYVVALMAMMFFLSLSNNPFSGDIVKETPEEAIAMVLTTTENPVTADDIKITETADHGKSILYIFEKDGEEWAAYADGDVFSMRYNILYQQIGEEGNSYTVEDYTTKYHYDYKDGKLTFTGEAFSIHDDLLFTGLEIIIIVIMLFAIGRKNKKRAAEE